jgi:hypothetical protein
MHGLNSIGVVSLQYADDTLLFFLNDLTYATNLKWILSCFEQMTRMRINFHECDLIPIRVDEHEAQVVSQTSSCRQGCFL